MGAGAVASAGAPRGPAAPGIQEHHPTTEIMKGFACGEVVPGCGHTSTAADESGILAHVAAHAAADHGLTDVPPALVEQVRARITAVRATRVPDREGPLRTPGARIDDGLPVGPQPSAGTAVDGSPSAAAARAGTTSSSR